MDTTRPVIPSAHAAFLSPNFFTIVTASVCAPPDASRIAPNIEPSPTNRAIPFSVLPIPSSTAVTISSNGMPAISPIAIAPSRIEIIAWILNLMIRTNSSARPTIAAMISLVVSSATTPSMYETLLFFLIFSRFG